jgi:methylated-DNA-protein-cysteine methyltransferase related protein
VAVSTQVILDRVKRIPCGFVSTYGDLSPGAPRQVGRALYHAGDDVPWWRVVRSDGSLAKGEPQRRRLMQENIPMRGERVILEEVLIDPEALH